MPAHRRLRLAGSGDRGADDGPSASQATSRQSPSSARSWAQTRARPAPAGGQLPPGRGPVGGQRIAATTMSTTASMSSAASGRRSSLGELAKVDQRILLGVDRPRDAADLAKARRLPEPARGIALEDQVEHHRRVVELARLVSDRWSRARPTPRPRADGHEVARVGDRRAAPGEVGAHVAAAREVTLELGDQDAVVAVDPHRPGVAEAHRRHDRKRAALGDGLLVGHVDVELVGEPQPADLDLGRRHARLASRLAAARATPGRRPGAAQNQYE